MAVAAGVAWGFAEGTLFFVVPDVLISRTALLSWRRALLQAVAASAGAVLAGALLFTWAADAPLAAQTVVRQVPFVRESMFEVAAVGLDAGAFGGLVRGSFSGIPYKVFAVEAPGHVAGVPFVVASGPARVLRFFLVAVCSALVAMLLRRLTPLGTSGLRLAHGAAWLAFYAYYWLTV
jgi:hypothetical protein